MKTSTEGMSLADTFIQVGKWIKEGTFFERRHWLAPNSQSWKKHEKYDVIDGRFIYRIYARALDFTSGEYSLLTPDRITARILEDLQGRAARKTYPKFKSFTNFTDFVRGLYPEIYKKIEPVSVVVEKAFNTGDRVFVYDSYRFAIPLRAEVINIKGRKIGIELKQSDNTRSPVRRRLWVFPEQLRHI